MLKRFVENLARSRLQIGFQIPEAIPRLTPVDLLVPHARALNDLEQLAALPRDYFDHYYRAAIDRYAEFVQQLPASEKHHHAAPGGMLRLGLATAVTALKLRRAYLLPPGASPEEITQKQDLWTYAVFTAALCHDLERPAIEQSVTLYDPQGHAREWVPWLGPMPESAQAYQTRFRKDRVPGLDERSALLLVGHIVPRAGLAWLASDLSLFSQWIACIGGSLYEAGAVGEIVSQAARESAARNLAPENGSGSGLKESPPEPSTRDFSPETFNPTQSSRTDTENTPQRFLEWIRTNIRNGTLPVDTPNARIHRLPEGLFLVTPAIFKDFVSHTGSNSSWDAVQKGFLKLGLHARTEDGLNIHQSSINGRRLAGIILPEEATG